MKPKAQMPEIERKEDDPLSDSVERHPAYGQIGASRVSGCAILYGSDFEHQHFVVIQISRSELHRGLSRDWPFARNEIIEVALSEAQWAAFVSTLNTGGGIQCTLQHVQGDKLPDIAAPERRHEQFKMEAAEKLKGALEALRAAREALAGVASSERQKARVREKIETAERAMTDGFPWVAKQFSEHMEKVTEKARIEVSAYVEATVRRAGLKELGAAPPIELPKKEA